VVSRKSCPAPPVASTIGTGPDQRETASTSQTNAPRHAFVSQKVDCKAVLPDTNIRTGARPLNNRAHDFPTVSSPRAWRSARGVASFAARAMWPLSSSNEVPRRSVSNPSRCLRAPPSRQPRGRTALCRPPWCRRCALSNRSSDRGRPRSPLRVLAVALTDLVLVTISTREARDPNAVRNPAIPPPMTRNIREVVRDVLGVKAHKISALESIDGGMVVSPIEARSRWQSPRAKHASALGETTIDRAWCLADHSLVAGTLAVLFR